MPELPPSQPPSPDPEPAPPTSFPRVMTCGHCGCTLARDGGVLTRGQRAASMVRLEERAERLETELEAARLASANVQAKLEAAEDQLRALTRKPGAFAWLNQ